MRGRSAIAVLVWPLCLSLAGGGCTNAVRPGGEPTPGGRGGNTAMVPALDRAGSLPLPPATGLPSELIPPGLPLQR